MEALVLAAVIPRAVEFGGFGIVSVVAAVAAVVPFALAVRQAVGCGAGAPAPEPPRLRVIDGGRELRPRAA